MSELLFELGVEEIPAASLSEALAALEPLAAQVLREARLGEPAVKVLGAPRRIALAAEGLIARQADVDETLVGPLVSLGEKARAGFARKNGLSPESVSEVDGKFVGRRTVAGKTAMEVLPAVLDALIKRIPFAKSMRWENHSQRFVRPVRWMVALFDGEVVPLEFAGIRSGAQSRGHRFHAPEPFAVRTIAEWRAGLAERFVIVDPAERRSCVQEELKRVEGETSLSVHPDEALLNEVTNLVEFPLGLSGSFDAEYLELPESVVISAMRRHQRYFAMRSGDGKLANRFATIAGTRVRDAAVVVHGNERVLRARLADARFFFVEDRKQPLLTHAERLASVVWVKQLGTMSEKVARVEKLAASLARRLGVDADKVARTARVAKADLVTHLVGEFPDLQGFVGAAYALAAGEDPEVSRAIAEHYQPRNASDVPAAGKVGATLAIADRIDTLVGCFAAGLQPKGSADPFALRRAALGVLQTLLQHGWHLSLAEVAEEAARGYTKPDAGKTVAQVLTFIEGRLKSLLGDKYSPDLVDAILSAGSSDPLDAVLRAEALSQFRSDSEFAPLSVAVKRVGNMLKNAGAPAAPSETLLTDPSEQALFAETGKIEKDVAPLLSSREYRAALATLSRLGAPIDAFFTNVFVMAEDPGVRANRMALLAQVNQLFLRIADFRQLSS